jgi:glycine/D-amino acid oxidase-like deaminating enzyme
MASTNVDIAVIGGGFYGCAVALFLRSVTERVTVIEAGDGLLQRASRVNQARVHSGFHYPRSFVTALRSRVLQRRFTQDFPEAIVSDFDMLYAVAARRSKVSAARFLRMFQCMDAPISRASARQRALFNSELVEDVFLCKEVAFDYTVLRDKLSERLDACGVSVRLGDSVLAMAAEPERTVLSLSSGDEIAARYVFNVTYANINNLLLRNGLQPLALKHELAEIALVHPPADLKGCAVTVVDGPFFSTMPYPSEGLYSLTHVRYTPHYSWVDRTAEQSPYQIAESLPQQTRWRHMMMDACRYVPCMSDIRYEKSLFDVKTVLVKNERDDGRPILLNAHQDAPALFSVMGAKIDNIYDLFEVLPTTNHEWQRADARYVLSQLQGTCPTPQGHHS